MFDPLDEFVGGVTPVQDWSTIQLANLSPSTAGQDAAPLGVTGPYGIQRAYRPGRNSQGRLLRTIRLDVHEVRVAVGFTPCMILT